MKKTISFLLLASFVSSESFSQCDCNETLQSVTTRGAATTQNVQMSSLSLYNQSLGFNRDVTNGYIFNNTRHAYQFQHTPSADPNADNLALQVYRPDGHGLAPFGLVINGNGNVGIGTATPGEKFHIAGNTRSEGLLKFYTSFPDGAGLSGIIANPNGWTRIDPNGGRFIMTVTREDVNAARNILDIEPLDTWQHLMELKADGSGFFMGNIGIGTSNPQSKLAVNGTVTTTKIKVTQQDWSDYVFDSSYNLSPLSKVEQFILRNKHLPEIPSAAEVKKEGLDLGDNQALLLKKIEELTLYIIQQNKKVESLEQKMTDLQAELKKK